MAKEVIVRILGDTQREPNPDASSSSGRQTPSAEAKDKKGEKSVLRALGAYAGKRVWSMMKSEAKYTIGKYFTVTEDYKGEMAMNNVLSTIDDFTSFASTLATGAVLGGSAGMIVAGAIAITSKAFTVFHTYENAMNAIVNNAYGNYFYGERAGFVAGGHGTEN